MSRKWILAWVFILGLLILLLPQSTPVRGQEPMPENDANCVSCHEHQYYLYDSGKCFCLCDAPMHCVYCHGGRTDSMIAEEAHEGMVLYPTRDNAERCQTCHTEDYMSRVVAFSEVAGVSSTPVPIITATPAALAAVPVDQPPSKIMLISKHFETWQLVGLSVMGLIIIGLIVFGIRCYRQDCLFKEKLT